MVAEATPSRKGQRERLLSHLANLVYERLQVEVGGVDGRRLGKPWETAAAILRALKPRGVQPRRRGGRQGLS